MATPNWTNVVSFGADPSGSSDSTSAITAAIASITGATGGVVYFPAGIYKVQSSSATPITVATNGITLLGDGPNMSYIKTYSNTTDLFDLTGSGAIVRGINFQANGTRTAGWYLKMSGNDTQVSNFGMTGVFGGILLTGNNQWVTEGEMGLFTPGSTGIQVTAGPATIRIDTVIMNGSTTTPSYGILVTNTADMKITDCDIISMGTDLSISPGSGQGVESLWVSQTGFDNGSGVAGGVNGIVIGPSGSGGVERLHFIGCWTSSHTNQGFLIANGSGSTVSGIIIMGHESYGNGANGLEIVPNPGAITGVEIIGGTFSGNTGNGILVGQNTTDFTITGTQIGSYGWSSANTSYGIHIWPGCDHYILSNNRLRNNNGGGTQIYNESSGSANNYVAGNIS